MKIRITLLIFLSIISFGISSTNPNENLKSSIGCILGWGTPYGNGVEWAYYLNNSINVVSGVGLSMAGYKWGVGSQLFFLEDNRFSHYIGPSVTINSGNRFINDDFTPEGDPITSVYDMQPGISMSIRTGIRYAFNWSNIYANVGYGFVIAGSGVDYVSGKRYLENPYERYRPKGVEISMGLKFRVSKIK